MPIAFTSREALTAVIAELGTRQREVYNFIMDWIPGADNAGPSIEDIARFLSRKECSVCARVNELMKVAAIELAPMKLNASGHKAKTYRALAFRQYSPPVKPQPQLDFFSGTPTPKVSPYSTRI